MMVTVVLAVLAMAVSFGAWVVLQLLGGREAVARIEAQAEANGRALREHMDREEKLAKLDRERRTTDEHDDREERRGRQTHIDAELGALRETQTAVLLEIAKVRTSVDVHIAAHEGVDRALTDRVRAIELRASPG